MTRTTLAVVFQGAGQPLELREIAIPALRDGEILVEMLACTLCGSDLHSLDGRRSVPLPTILGHETLGTIAEFAPEAERIDAAGLPLDIGDRVTWGVVANCGECFYCRRQLPQKCERQTKYGHEPLRPGRELTGGLAGHCVLVPGTAIFKVPEGLSDAAACPANCAAATVAAAVEAAGPLEGRRVLVMGAGMLGVTAAAWARALGAEAVIACDILPERRALATQFNATHAASPEELAKVNDESTDGYGCDIAMELTGSPDAVESLIPFTRMGGSIILVGSVFATRPVSVSAEQIVRRCLAIRGIHNYAPRHLNAALQVLESQRSLPFASLVNDWRPLSALEGLLGEPLPPNKLRIGIRPRL